MIKRYACAAYRDCQAKVAKSNSQISLCKNTSSSSSDSRPMIKTLAIIIREIQTTEILALPIIKASITQAQDLLIAKVIQVTEMLAARIIKIIQTMTVLVPLAV